MKQMTILFLIVVSTFQIAACQSAPQETPSEPIHVAVDTVVSYRMRTLQTYLDSTDLTGTLSADSLFGVLYALRYGEAPRRLSHLALTEAPDTLLIQTAAAEFLTTDQADFLQIIRDLEPKANQYQRLKEHYPRLWREGKTDSLALLHESLNAYRWIQRFTDSTFALVNIPSAELWVNGPTGHEQLRMRAIVGSRSHQTPAFATYSPEIITYPYWNVPRSIAVGEILPKVKRSIAYLERNNMQVIGSNGRLVDPATVNWAALGSSHFPYRFRQSTGCDNALGIIKFNLASPYAIYMHDTNSRSLFARSARWLSHGCIRLQKPTELANLMLAEPVFDEGYLEQCRINARSGSIRLARPFPVFILYLRADIDEQGNLRWNKDVYNWY